MTNTPILIKDVDYTINEDGNLVFTKTYLLKRGYCCQSGCLNCPYDYASRIDPNIPAEFNDAWETNDFSEDSEED